ncbi:hypothetical protein SBV1_510004 [Verrucomicrobia bacterium]|nr:hypothetical protein SBV1_510004 [Verrucomicrobiota bacterium]
MDPKTMLNLERLRLRTTRRTNSQIPFITVLGPTARLIPAQGGVSATLGSEPQEKAPPR